MRAFANFNDVHTALQAFVHAAPASKDAYTLDRIQSVLKKLGNPQDAVRVVHVAGTSGKTSTSYYIAALLTRNGCKVGLSVSPHIDEINERLQINMVPLEEAAYCHALTEFFERVQPAKVPGLTYFELLVAFAYWYFAREQVDYAVMEVGVGGLLDGTNVVTREDKVCVITDIGIDHAQILGSTLSAIAAQKAGIIQAGNHVFGYTQVPEIHAQITQAAEQKQAIVHACEYDPAVHRHINLPDFQRRNWVLAAHVFQYIAERDGLRPMLLNDWQASQAQYIPGRMERLKIGSKTVILDGSHNPQKMQAFARSLLEQGIDGATCILTFKQDKDIAGALTALRPVVGMPIAVAFQSQQDTVHISLPVSSLADLISENIGTQPYVASTLGEALHKALAGPSEYILVCGSFYILHEARAVVQRLQ